MTTVATCGACCQRHTVGAASAGKRLKCRACGEPINVTRAIRPTTSPGQPAFREQEDPQQSVSPSLVRPVISGRTALRRRSGPVLFPLAGCIVLTGALVAVIMLFAAKDSSLRVTQTTQPDPPLPGVSAELDSRPPQRDEARSQRASAAGRHPQGSVPQPVQPRLLSEPRGTRSDQFRHPFNNDSNTADDSVTHVNLAHRIVDGTELLKLKRMKNLRSINLSEAQISDHGLTHLQDLRQLQKLDLSGNPVSDTGLARLRALTSLRWLDLTGTAVTDAGFVHLHDLTNLRSLYLDHVTDRGLEQLSELPGLRLLSLADSTITDDGVNAFSEALPDCRLHLASALPPAPPPPTAPLRKQLGYSSAPLFVEVLEDSTSADASIAGLTKLRFPEYRFPGYQYDPSTNRITGFKDHFRFQGAITIQTVYGPRASPQARSLYGRGTTVADRLQGNLSLGYHESCHQQDYLQHVTSGAIPEFGYRVGMTVAQFTAATKKFSEEYAVCLQETLQNSVQQTDEVGMKLSVYSARNPSFKGHLHTHRE